MVKINTEAIIEAYNKGESMNSIAKRFYTYPTTVKRLLEKNHVLLRHDATTKGSFVVKDGEKLIEWAKAQGRLVTKAELAKVLGTKRLSPSYFIKYPELGQYVKANDNKDVQDHIQKLYDWLKENKIPYKPNDRTKLGVSVDALLLGEYSNIALQLSERPYYVSKKLHEQRMLKKFYKAKTVGLNLIFVHEEDFKNLDDIMVLINDRKK